MQTEARMTHPVMQLPAAMQALQALKTAIVEQGLPAATLDLVDLRVSQINGCSTCVDGHWRIARQAGESDERLFAVAAWRDAPYFDEAERAALALAEALTRTADREEAVPDALWDAVAEHYDETQRAALLLAIGQINLWNRLNIGIRQPAGQWNP